MNPSESEQWRARGRSFHSEALKLDDYMNGRHYLPGNSLGYQQQQQQQQHQQESNSQTPPRKYDLLQSAIRCYKKAITKARSLADEASAHKNCAKAYSELCSLTSSPELMTSVLHHWNLAIHCGLDSSAFDDGWLAEVQREYERSFSQCLSSCEDGHVLERVSRLDRIVRALTVGDCLKFACLLKMCSILEQDSSRLCEAGDYGMALTFAKECANHLKEAQAEAFTDSEKDIVQELKNYNELTRIEASAMEKVKQADDLLEAMIRERRMNEEALYEIIDWYTRAVQLTEENGLDASVPYQRLAHVYRNEMKNEERAAYYDRQSRENHSEVPRKFPKSFLSLGWRKYDLPVARHKAYKGAENREQNKKDIEYNRKDTEDKKENPEKNKKDTEKYKQHTEKNKDDTERNREHPQRNKENVEKNKEDTERNEEHSVRNKKDIEKNKENIEKNKKDTERNREHSERNKEHSKRSKEDGDKNKEDTEHNKEHTESSIQHAETCNKNIREHRQDTEDNILDAKKDQSDSKKNKSDNISEVQDEQTLNTDQSQKPKTPHQKEELMFEDKTGKRAGGGLHENKKQLTEEKEGSNQQDQKDKLENENSKKEKPSAKGVTKLLNSRSSKMADGRMTKAASHRGQSKHTSQVSQSMRDKQNTASNEIERKFKSIVNVQEENKPTKSEKTNACRAAKRKTEYPMLEHHTPSAKQAPSISPTRKTGAQTKNINPQDKEKVQCKAKKIQRKKLTVFSRLCCTTRRK